MVASDPPVAGSPAIGPDAVDDATDSPLSDTAVVVPVKSFALAKGRLAEALSAPNRAQLARSMAATVIGAASTLPVFVATDDDEVAAWATDQGRPRLAVSVTGLNAVATEVVDMLAHDGYHYVMICHADLPLARDLDAVAGFPGVTIVPDRHGDGTNVIVVPTASGFRFHYGPGSAHHHRHEAARLGLRMRWLRLDHLAWDIDVPEDLDALTRLATASVRHRPTHRAATDPIPTPPGGQHRDRSSEPPYPIERSSR